MATIRVSMNADQTKDQVTVANDLTFNTAQISLFVGDNINQYGSAPTKVLKRLWGVLREVTLQGVTEDYFVIVTNDDAAIVEPDFAKTDAYYDFDSDNGSTLVDADSMGIVVGKDYRGFQTNSASSPVPNELWGADVEKLLSRLTEVLKTV